MTRRGRSPFQRGQHPAGSASGLLKVCVPFVTGIDAAHRKVIFASSLGTVFEWYDFYLYGTLAVFFSALFFPPGNDTAAFLASLATFGAGFAVRPLGALVFGRIGDLVGRKYTFLITIVVMGLSTALVGVLPTYAQIGIWAPILLVTLRLAQGLALGGEYGGAATYVAEHAPHGQRGYYTSWIQTTATLGFFLSLAVILACRLGFGEEAFKAWGWRVPFLISVALLAVSVYIRLRLQESPVFAEMKAEGKLSKAPLKESFGQWQNARIVLLALLGATAGQGVVWYTGQFYALFFLQNTLKLDYQTTYLLIAAALVIGTPFFVYFGRLSDRIGRKRIMVAGCLLAALTFIPIFKGLTQSVNPALAEFQARAAVTVAGADCRFRIFARPETPCDQARDFLTKAGVNYEQAAPEAGEAVVTTIAGQRLTGFDEAAYRAALDDCRLPDGPGPGAHEPAGHAAPARDPDAVRDHGVRPDRRLPRRAVPDADPLLVDEPAVPHRQRLVRRLPAVPRRRARRAHRQHLLRALVPDPHRRDERPGRTVLPARDQGRRPPLMTAAGGPTRAARPRRRALAA